MNHVGTVRLVIASAVLFGLGIRLAFGLGYWVNKPLTQDEREHLALARSLASGSGFRYPPSTSSTRPGEQFSRAPLYPAFVALIGGKLLFIADPESALDSVKIAQSIVGALGVFLVAAIAWRAAGPTAAAIASVIAAVYPPLIWICAYALSEALYSTFALLTVLILGTVTDQITVVSKPRWIASSVFSAGVLGGVSALARPPALMFLAFAALWLITRHSRRLAILFIVGALATIGPWTFRNVQEHDRLVLVSAQGGVNFWIGNHPLAIGEGDMAANPSIKQSNAEFRQRHIGLTPEELEPFYYREAFSYIIDHPTWWIGLIARKFFFLWVPIGPSYTLHSALYLWASVLSYSLVLPFAMAGAVRLWQTKRVPVALTLTAVSAFVTSMLFFPQERFRIPVLDPTLIICAAVWISKRKARDL